MSDGQRGALPDTLQAWVDERAASADEDPSDVLSRAVTLYRLVEDHTETAGKASANDDAVDQLDDLLGALDEFEELDGKLTAIEDDVDEKIDDIRSRVIQVKREGDRERAALEDRLGEVESTVDDGFENFGEILSRLADESDALDEKLTRLAVVAVSLRRRAATAEQRLAGLNTATELKEAANRHDITKAKCEDCSGGVSLGLLTEPRCPHCDATFADIEPTRRPFSAAKLTTVSHPALTAGDESTDDAETETDSENRGTASESDAEPETLETAAADLLEDSGRV